MPPVANQCVAAGHATALSELPRLGTGFGLATTAHVAPFQLSTKVFPEPEIPAPWAVDPTAKQLVAPEQVTPRSALAGRSVAFGLVMIDHADPFQCSTNVFCVELTCDDPTAKQLKVVGQCTPYSSVTVEPAGFGSVTSDHAAPFQRSPNGVWLEGEAR
jgi:hypothetical protein